MKTIKQIADEIGVSKTAVRKKMTEEVKTKFSQTVSGKIYISETGENIIKSSFKSNISETGNNKPEEIVSSKVSTEVPGENILYNILKNELDEKNMQIKKLQLELEIERKYSREQTEKVTMLADQAQRLHLAEISQSETVTKEIELETIENVPSFWKQIFSKKKK